MCCSVLQYVAVCCSVRVSFIQGASLPALMADLRTACGFKRNFGSDTPPPLPVNPTRPVSEVLKRLSFLPVDIKPLSFFPPAFAENEFQAWALLVLSTSFTLRRWALLRACTFLRLADLISSVSFGCNFNFSGITKSANSSSGSSTSFLFFSTDLPPDAFTLPDASSRCSCSAASATALGSGFLRALSVGLSRMCLMSTDSALP
mmetsp:Transcript_48659/g.41097  ORF Transcript_48659/g.41097 Transcript_48659/m.41097 type:complete len:204 (-) Transcript_48659:312-923(-)